MELEGLHWGAAPECAVALVLDDGSQLLTASDQECNGPGALFLFNKSGNHLISDEAGAKFTVT
jgi:hypothetical protein